MDRIDDAAIEIEKRIETVPGFGERYRSLMGACKSELKFGMLVQKHRRGRTKPRLFFLSPDGDELRWCLPTNVLEEVQVVRDDDTLRVGSVADPSSYRGAIEVAKICAFSAGAGSRHFSSTRNEQNCLTLYSAKRTVALEFPANTFDRNRVLRLIRNLLIDGKVSGNGPALKDEVASGDVTIPKVIAAPVLPPFRLIARLPSNRGPQNTSRIGQTPQKPPALPPWPLKEMANDQSGHFGGKTQRSASTVEHRNAIQRQIDLCILDLVGTLKSRETGSKPESVFTNERVQGCGKNTHREISIEERDAAINHKRQAFRATDSLRGLVSKHKRSNSELLEEELGGLYGIDSDAELQGHGRQEGTVVKTDREGGHVCIDDDDDNGSGDSDDCEHVAELDDSMDAIQQRFDETMEALEFDIVRRGLQLRRAINAMDLETADTDARRSKARSMDLQRRLTTN